MKLLKSLLICLICLTLGGCGQSRDIKSSKEVGEILEKNGYELIRMDSLVDYSSSDIVRSVYIKSEDNEGMAMASFDEDKKLVNAYYSEEDETCITEGEGGDDEPLELKDKYDAWLEKLDITHEELITYLTEENKKVRKPNEIDEIIKDCHFKEEIGSVTGVWDHTVNLLSDNYTIGVCYRNKKLGKFIFLSDITTGTNKMFVWEQGKVKNEDGYNNYYYFLTFYNMTHEEFIGYLESLYENNFEE